MCMLESIHQSLFKSMFTVFFFFLQFFFLFRSFTSCVLNNIILHLLWS